MLGSFEIKELGNFYENKTIRKNNNLVENSEKHTFVKTQILCRFLNVQSNFNPICATGILIHSHFPE